MSNQWGAVHRYSTREQQTLSLVLYHTSLEHILHVNVWELRKSDFNPSVRCRISSVTDHAVGGIPKKKKNSSKTHTHKKTVISPLAVTSTVNALGSFEGNTNDTGTKWLCWGSPINREQGHTKGCGFLTDLQWFLRPSDTRRSRLDMNVWPG